MRFKVISACALACAIGLTASDATKVYAHPAARQADAKVSGAERDAAEKINKAKGGEAKLQAAAEFVKKYPQSSLRPRVAQSVAAEIAATTEADLKISLAETFLSFFNQPEEAEHVNGLLLTAYLDANRTDKAFGVAQAWLAKFPEDADTLSRLAIAASNEAIRDNNAYTEQGQRYGAKAIEILEADRKPAAVDAAQWAAFKTATLPALYRATGVMSLKAGDKAAARTRLEKAASLNLNDPAIYLVLVDLANDDYEALARQYKASSAGAERDALLKRVNESLDAVIEAQARAVARIEGNAQLQQAHDQLRQDLERSYKYRHNNSTDGLQELINKYKRPAQ